MGGYENIFYLNENSAKIDRVPGLKTELFLHQKTIVARMIDLENNTIYKQNNIKCRTSIGILAEPMGSGKTIDILSIILLQPQPRPYRIIGNIVGIAWFKKYKYILKPTLIFVGSSVLNQWLQSIKKFTDLKVLVVANLYDMETFLDIMYQNKLNEYDIVLAKVGKIIRIPIKYPHEFAHIQSNIYTLISGLYELCWSRVVIDDYDVINLPRQEIKANSIFSWYVSSTKQYNCPQKIQHEVRTTEELFSRSSASVYNLTYRDSLYSNFVVKNECKFIESCNKLSTPLFFIHKVPNKNDKIIGAITNLDAPEFRKIAEMLNSDAVEDAAEKLGIKTYNVIDIFENIFGKHYFTFKQSITILSFIEQQIDDEKNWELLPCPPEGEKYTKKELINLTPINYNYNNMLAFLSKQRDIYKNIKNDSYKIIERIKSNLKEGECPICSCDLEDEDIVIFKCCSSIICSGCCFNVIFKNISLPSKCANCRTKVDVKQVIFLSNLEFNCDKLVDELDEKKVDEIILEQKYIKEEPKTLNGKLNAIIDIICSTHKGKRCKVNIGHLMTGPFEAECSNKKKILIFGNYDSSLDELKHELDKIIKITEFKLLQLNGTYNNISKIVQEFNDAEKNCLLFINSMKNCAGLNLQTATELIFIHRIMDIDIESQVIGRAQRLFRTSRLQVHFVVYENENSHIKSNIYEYD